MKMTTAIENILAQLEAYRPMYLDNQRSFRERMLNSMNAHCAAHIPDNSYSFSRKMYQGGYSVQVKREAALRLWRELYTETKIDVPTDHPQFDEREKRRHCSYHIYSYEKSDKFEEIVAREANEAFLAGKANLSTALHRHLSPYENELVELWQISLTGLGNIQGTWGFKLADGKQGTIKTQTIWAGGHNIQCLHMRYMVHVTLAKVKAAA